MQVTVITLTPTTVHACHLGMEWDEPSQAKQSRAKTSQGEPGWASPRIKSQVKPNQDVIEQDFESR